jgi:hypothetical protein
MRIAQCGRAARITRMARNADRGVLNAASRLSADFLRHFAPAKITTDRKNNKKPADLRQRVS